VYVMSVLPGAFPLLIVADEVMLKLPQRIKLLRFHP